MSEPRYPYVHLIVSEDDSELASSELWDLGAQGIEERDGSTLIASEPGTLTLVASFADEAAAGAALAALDGRWPASLQFVEGDGWRDAYKAYFKPTRIGERLVVRPSWEPYSAQANDVVLTLDPGRAFGTGTHESTRLALALAERYLQPGQRVLDVGCGSGILSIACLLLGASEARAIDIDPDAAVVADENAHHNGVHARLSADASPIAAIDARYPLVLANIESRVLVPMAAELCARLEPGATLILSGLLA
ncbi:MAG TPA: 50S ribosomal protein L11 methyltransferase, partial [Polyangiales bacterium]|nr:50S ribosomal protein L11 methyltransferase [Polyangiales bacterium]